SKSLLDGKVSRRTDALSPSASMPTIATPNAPIPTHTAYAVPTGKLFNATESITKLVTAAARPIVLGQKRVNPSANFSATAHTISRRPAPIKMVQAMAVLPLTRPVPTLIIGVPPMIVVVERCMPRLDEQCVEPQGRRQV